MSRSSELAGDEPSAFATAGRERVLLEGFVNRLDVDVKVRAR